MTILFNFASLLMYLQTLAFLKGNQKLFEMILQDEHQISLEPRNQFESDEE